MIMTMASTTKVRINRYSIRPTNRSDVLAFASFAKHKHCKRFYFFRNSVSCFTAWANAMTDDVPSVSRYIFECDNKRAAFFNFFRQTASRTFITGGVFPDYLGQFTGVVASIYAIETHFRSPTPSCLYCEIEEQNLPMIRIVEHLGFVTDDKLTLNLKNILILKLETRMAFQQSAKDILKRYRLMHGTQ